VERNKKLGRRLLVAAALAGVMIALGACTSDGKKETVYVLFSAQNNELDLYDLTTGAATVFIAAEQNNVNGQACAVPNGKGQFLMGEDTKQSEGARQGWMIFSSDGKPITKLLEPSAPNEPEQIEPYGCVFDNQKRLFVSDVGQEDFEGASGKLIVFFPPDYTTYCMLSNTLRVAGNLAMDDDGSILVTETLPPGAVLRFKPPFPEDADACETTPANMEVFIQDPDVGTPSGIARAPNGNWYVSSVFVPPAINEYDQDGNLVRNIASGDDIGNPQGIAVGPDGTIFYADLGLVQEPGKLPGPGDHTGTVRKIAFDELGRPKAPEVIASGLDYPDAVSILPKPNY
jgi:sugar lactone lactonase YvrE